MVYLQSFQSQLRLLQFVRSLNYDLWFWLFALKDFLDFLFTCQLRVFLRRCVSVIVCVIGITIGLLYLWAEWLNTQGTEQGSLEKLQLAAKIFPFDQRF